MMAKRDDDHEDVNAMVFDAMLALSLAGFCIAWVWRGPRVREQTLWLLAFAGLISAALSVLEGRWHAAPGGAVAVLFLLILVFKRRGAKGKGQAEAPRGIAWVSGGCLGLLGLVSLSPIYLFPLADMPTPTGRHLVGVRDFDLVDPARTGVLGAAAGEARKLNVRVWYPAAESAAAIPPRRYATPEEARTVFAGLAGSLEFPAFFFSHLQLVRTHSRPDAPVLTDSGARLPVVYFSHGYFSYAAQNTALMEELASHGYVVFSLSHTGDSPVVLFADGSSRGALAPTAADGLDELSEGFVDLVTSRDDDVRFAGVVSTADEGRERNHRIQQSAPIWLEDRLFVSRALASGDAPQSVGGVLAASDFSRTAHLGMSFGGSTAGAVCFLDPTCAAGVNLDGGDYHYLAVNASPPAPFLMVHSDWRDLPRQLGRTESGDPTRAFNDFSYESWASAGERGDIYRLRINRLHHLGLSDYGLFLRQPVRGPLAGDMEGRRLAEILNAAVLGFLDKHMRGRDNGFPQALFAAYPDEAVHHDAGYLRGWWNAKTPDAQAVLAARADRLAGRTPAPEPVPVP